MGVSKMFGMVPVALSILSVIYRTVIESKGCANSIKCL